MGVLWGQHSTGMLWGDTGTQGCAKVPWGTACHLAEATGAQAAAGWVGRRVAE